MRATEPNSKHWLPWFTVGGLFLLALWIDRVWLLLQDGGLFRVVGIDFSMYVSQALILRSSEPGAIYDLARVNANLQSLVVYTTDPSQPLSAGPVEYLPTFAGLILPFTLVPPPVGFVLWTMVNLTGLVYLAWRVCRVVPGLPLPQAVLALLITFPMAIGLIVGQPTALLGCAVAEWYLATRGERELRAGLWLAVLLIKPQYGILIGPLLLWKRRWRTVLGVAMGACVLLMSSIVVAGVPSLLTYYRALVDIAPWGGGPLASPGQMINWRALILNLRPSIGPTTGLVLTATLGLVTVVVALSLWRGPWSPRSWSFVPRLGVLILATILANYHSHVHGLALFVVPLAACFAQPGASSGRRWALAALAFGPSVVVIGIQHWLVRDVILHQPPDVLIWSPITQVLLTLATVMLLWDVVRSTDGVTERALPPWTAGPLGRLVGREAAPRQPAPAGDLTPVN